MGRFRTMEGTLARLILRIAAVAAMAFIGTAGHAQIDEIRVGLAAEEAVSDSTVVAIKSTIADERARLLVKLQANAPDQTSGALTTTTSELAGQTIAGAMRRLLVFEPHGQAVIVGIDPQVGPDGSRQLVLLNISAWIAKGRRLGVNDLETFAILPDQEIRQSGGSQFQLEGIAYYGAVEGSSLVFHRKP